ncbi:arsenate reductase [Desulforhopalus sp. 52FAK]
MAEGWAKALKHEQIDAYSAGITKHGLNPFAIKAMAEAGVDISKQESNLINELPIEKFDWVITLCGHADDTCPFFPGKRIHVGFDDPPKLAEHAGSDEEKLVHYRRVRDEIKVCILSLPGFLENK